MTCLTGAIEGLVLKIGLNDMTRIRHHCSVEVYIPLNFVLDENNLVRFHVKLHSVVSHRIFDPFYPASEQGNLEHFAVSSSLVYL